MANFRLADDDDLERHFGSDRLLVGVPVRPPSTALADEPPKKTSLDPAALAALRRLLCSGPYLGDPLA
jgi:hypothetical protein